MYIIIRPLLIATLERLSEPVNDRYMMSISHIFLIQLITIILRMRKLTND